MVVYDSADLDSAAESVVDAIWFNQGQVCSAGSKLLVQEPIYDKFVDKLKKRLERGFRIGERNHLFKSPFPPKIYCCVSILGTSLDKTYDMGAIVSQSQLKSIAAYVDEAKEDGADVFQIATPEGCYYPPTIITNVSTASRVCAVKKNCASSIP